MTAGRAAAGGPGGARPSFPRVFWAANLTELFERGAYYAIASFVVLYLGRLGLGAYWPSTLNGFLWTLVYFLPILSGTIADQVGFRRALLVAFVLLAAGYFLMGWPVWFGGAVLADKSGATVTAPAETVVPLVAALVLIGLGGSVVKPCISGTVQKTAAGRATLAFGVFYMVINIGSLFGRASAYLVRTRTTLSAIFAVAAVCAVLAFLVVLFLYREPAPASSAPPRPRRPVARILLDMLLVLRNGRFALFLLVSTGFFFLYAQVYNVLPLYLEKVVEANPPVDLYTAANPLTIVAFQLLVTKRFGRLRPIRSMIVGAVAIGLAMALNLVPLLLPDGARSPLGRWIPVGSLFVVMTVVCIAMGELFTSARSYEFIGALAPKGQEGLFLGYANLPMALGALVGGPVGAAVVNDLMCRGAAFLPDAFDAAALPKPALLFFDWLFARDTRLLVPVPARAMAGWLLLMGVGFATALLMWLYDRWLTRARAREEGGAAP